MPRVKQKPASPRTRKAAGPLDQRWGTYVYCIVESANLKGIFDSAPEGLEGARPIEPLLSAGFAAVVSSVPLSQYGEGALDANLSDINWAASRLMSHERVVEHFASRRSVIPLRFGSIHVDRASIGKMLADRSAEFKSVMQRLRGRQEWGVSIYCDHALLVETQMSENPEIRLMFDRINSAPPGQAYLLSKQIEGLKAKVVREEISSAVVRMKQKLDASSEQSTATLPARTRRPEREDLVARMSFLVRTRQFDRFRASAEELARTYLSSGFRIELVGPLPPYSFVAETSTRAVAR
jgi:hypothetical protein